MYDLIVIEQDTFRNTAKQISYENNKYIEKLEKLFNENACFSIQPTSYSNGAKQWTKSNNGGYYSKQNGRGGDKEVRKKLFCDEPVLKPIDKILRTVRMYINILNNGNSKSIQKKLHTLVSTLTVNEQSMVLNEFMVKSIEHTPYLKVYIDLITSIFDKELITHCSSKQAYNLEMSLDNRIHELIELDTSVYDNFCYFQKQKELLKNEIFILINTLDSSKSKFESIIYDILSSRYDNISVDESIQDFIIDILIYLYDQTCLQDVKDFIMYLYRNNLTSTKSKFRMESSLCLSGAPHRHAARVV